MKNIPLPVVMSLSLASAALGAVPLPPPRPPTPLLPPPAGGTSGGAPVQAPKPPLPPPSNSNPVGAPPTAGRFSVPLSGISAAQVQDFLAGRGEFLKQETAATGLGPIFNDVSCVACHFEGGAGGGSRRAVTRFGRLVNGVFDPLAEQGGSLLQERAIDRAYLEHIPREANVVARRITTPLFGAGLVEAIPDATLIQNASVSKTDGVKGRVAMVKDPVSGEMRVGRFGWKAQHATLLGFSADAYLNEMGITNRFFPVENAPNGNQALLAAADKFVDPEDVVDPATRKSDIDKAADFMRLLAPVPRGPVTERVTAGGAVFQQVGCAQCHVPSMKTGPDGPIGIRNQTVALYSDLLLHDMGALGDGIAQPPAEIREMRTAPLWGLRIRERYLHDGRATSVDQAIVAHDGEARIIRARYQALPATQKAALLEFLNSL